MSECQGPSPPLTFLAGCSCFFHDNDKRTPVHSLLQAPCVFWLNDLSVSETLTFCGPLPSRTSWMKVERKKEGIFKKNPPWCNHQYEIYWHLVELMICLNKLTCTRIPKDPNHNLQYVSFFQTSRQVTSPHYFHPIPSSWFLIPRGHAVEAHPHFVWCTSLAANFCNDALDRHLNR